ncbi:UBIQUITIN-CONJUGAT-2 domain-containing protein [Salix suchowensis]|nr:UBIQUITIN-CONJUGAT-2 domain-containing protein [Salix suchowensis]
MAGHFQQILASSDLREKSDFDEDRIGLLGTGRDIVASSGVYLTTSESQDADVECFASESDVVPMDESIAALLFSFFTLLALAVMRHRSGDEHMWYGPVTSCAWFNRYNKSSGLPGPGGKPGTRAVAYTEKPRRTRSRSQASPRQPSAAVHNDRGRTQRTTQGDRLQYIRLQWAQPRTEVPLVFILGALWLGKQSGCLPSLILTYTLKAMGAWSTTSRDVIGNTQCDTLGGARTPLKTAIYPHKPTVEKLKSFRPSHGWSSSYVSKSMIYFPSSSSTFAFLVVFWFIIMIQLINQAQRFGRWRIWEEPIRELGWFGEMPGYYNQHNGAAAYPQAGYIPYGYGYGYPMVQQPQGGQSIIIQPGSNGQPATVTTVPMSSV